MKYTAILLLSLILAVHGHEGHHEERMTRAVRDATHNFARSCTKRATSACVLQSEVTEGPYYYDTQFVRRDITEGFAGIPFSLNISVIDINTCQPIQNAAVDIWHCNALGIYSHYQNSNNNGGANTTFLRGIQISDSNGNVSFTSIFPGWYQPRVIHIHVKVHIGGTAATTSSYSGGSVVHTGQMFVTDNVGTMLKSVAPYSSNTQSLSTLSQDNIYGEAGTIALMDLQYSNFADGVFGSITLGVDSGATVASTSSANPDTSTTKQAGTSPTTSSSPAPSSTSSASSSTSSVSSTTQNSSTPSQSSTGSTTSQPVDNSAASVSTPLVALFALLMLLV